MRSQRTRRCWLWMQKQSQATARQSGKYGSTDDAKATNDKKHRERERERAEKILSKKVTCLSLRCVLYSVGMFLF
jgi:hypothetical protein